MPVRNTFRLFVAPPVFFWLDGVWFSGGMNEDAREVAKHTLRKDADPPTRRRTRDVAICCQSVESLGTGTESLSLRLPNTNFKV